MQNIINCVLVKCRSSRAWGFLENASWNSRFGGKKVFKQGCQTRGVSYCVVRPEKPLLTYGCGCV